MPGLAVHSQIVNRLLRYWRVHKSITPFNAEDDCLCNAFMNGAIGPDMGYYPGGDPQLTDLAHYISTGQLVRAMITRSQTPLEIAFSFGWLSHVIADGVLHPIINRAHSVYVGSGHPVIYSDDPVTHIRIEAGVDLRFFLDNPFPVISFKRAFKAGELKFLASAYAEVYGDDFSVSSKALFRSHQGVANFYPIQLRLSRILCNIHYNTRVGLGDYLFRKFLFQPIRFLGTVLKARMSTYPLTHLILPSSELIEEMNTGIDSVVETLQSYRKSELKNLKDINLDTGR